MKMKIFFLLAFLACTFLDSNAQVVNAALGKQLVFSSEDNQYKASQAVDGNRDPLHGWKTVAGKAGPHFIEIDLHKYHRIASIVLTGASVAAGSTPGAVKVQYWDDANWTDINESPVADVQAGSVTYNFTQPVTSFSVRIQSVAARLELSEIEVFGTLVEGQPLPNVSPSRSTDTGSRSLKVKIENVPAGTSMKYVGYNQGYFLPGTNVPGWLEYSGVNSLRVWTALSEFAPPAAFPAKEIADLAAFNEAKKALRAQPGTSDAIDWNNLRTTYASESQGNKMVFDYALDELKKLGVDVVLQINERTFDDNWTQKWLRWRQFYSLAYHAAEKGGVRMFAMHNEPNHRAAGPMSLETWMRGLQIASDAVRAAVADVNAKRGLKLQARFVAPVTAGNNTDWWAYVVSHIRDGYDGKKLDHDLFDIFSTHSYNQPAIGYATRVKDITEVIRTNHPLKQALPVVFTETGRWMNALLIDKDETYDAPSVFTEWAGMYANNMKNGGYGMWAFKFANTTSDVYPRGIKSGHHLTWQGTRIVEDAYLNLAQGKAVTAAGGPAGAVAITDGDKTDRSAWQSDAVAGPKSLTIDLGAPVALGSAVVYTGSALGVYTGSDRVKNFSLQYLAADGSWKDIPAAVEKNSKYVQIFSVFKSPVTTSQVRWTSSDSGRLKVREIKLFAAGDGPSTTPDYNVSGLLRTGEVVRLFAKGFKDERPLLKTTADHEDKLTDTYTAFDKPSGNYYMWLVQRGNFTYNITIDLSSLGLPAGTPVTIETVDRNHYGEVTKLLPLPANGTVSAMLPAQSVQLLTIAGTGALVEKLVPPAQAAMVSGGNSPAEGQSSLLVSLDASKRSGNRVSYINFKPGANEVKRAKKALLKVYGNSGDDSLFRMHVYVIPGNAALPAKLQWSNAPLLDSVEALIHSVGTRAFIAGQLAFGKGLALHQLDVTSLLQKHPATHYTFVFIRETRQLGDDLDKGRSVTISPSGDTKPALSLWLPNK